MRKLLLVGMKSVHTYNFIKSIESYFDEILLITDTIDNTYPGKAIAINFSVGHAFHYFSVVSLIRKTVSGFNPSVIHIHQANTAAWLVLKAIGNRRQSAIVTAWGSDVLLNPRRGFLYRKMTKQVLQSAGYLTAVAPFMATVMHQLANNNRPVEIINLGIDPIFADRKELEVSLPGKENIIFSNRLHKKLYRIDHIIKAFATFVNQNKDHWKLVIAGTGPETKNLHRLVVQEGIAAAVQFVGWISAETNAYWYRKAKIFASYPISDGAPASLFEAMSAGCIPVLSDLPANNGWVTNKVNGIVTAQISSMDFESAIQLNSSNMLIENYELIVQRASRKQSRKLFIDLYDRVIAHS